MTKLSFLICALAWLRPPFALAADPSLTLDDVLGQWQEISTQEIAIDVPDMGSTSGSEMVRVKLDSIDGTRIALRSEDTVRVGHVSQRIWRVRTAFGVDLDIERIAVVDGASLDTEHPPKLSGLFILFPCLRSANCWTTPDLGVATGVDLDCPQDGACPTESDAALQKKWESESPEYKLTDFGERQSNVPLYWADREAANQVRNLIAAKLRSGD